MIFFLWGPSEVQDLVHSRIECRTENVPGPENFYSRLTDSEHAYSMVVIEDELAKGPELFCL